MMRIARPTLRSGAPLLIGCVILTVWILFRFSTKSVNFDLVGQQLLARQWLDGNMEGSVVGPTNYMLKMVFLYMPAELLSLDQKVFLIASTVLVNAVTFVGIYLLLKRILHYFSIEAGNIFTLSMLWFATIAGSVFWVQFTNSRNLEIVAGLLLLYIGLVLYKNSSLRYVLLFLLLAGLTYFSDPLQLFVTSGGLVAYVGLNSLLIEKEKRKEPFVIVALVAGGYILSRLLVVVVQNLTGVELIGVNTLSHMLMVASNLPVTIVETAKNILRLVAGTNEMGAWRQLFNIMFVGCLMLFSIATLIKNKIYLKHPSFVLFSGLMVAVPVAVYMASGQPLFTSDDTSRYLIMLAPALILLFSLGDTKYTSLRVKQVVATTIILTIFVNSVSLFGALFTQEKGNLLRSTYIESRYHYLKEANYDYGYASMDAAIPAMYLLGKSGTGVLLPLACEGGLLRKSILFYDKNVFLRNEKQTGIVPIILDGDAIRNYPASCSVESIQAQFGTPLRLDKSADNTVLLYSAEQLQALHF